MQEADSWLENLANDNANEWLRGIEGDEPSPPTSMATDTRMAHGTIYKGCRCPAHQDIYNDWPTQDAELRIAKCMRICVYCGKDFPVAAELRKHMRKVPEYAQRNLTVYMEPGGRATASTPAWTRTRQTEPPAGRPESRTTRSRSTIDSTDATPPPSC